MAKKKLAKRKLDALPDTLDFRDRMYVPTLVEVPTTISLDEYRKLKAPILDQGEEGACTGFGLAAVAHYLLRKRKHSPDLIQVSPRMFYDVAKRYDEWPGENYEGSSARGAMKGWHKHGVCALDRWPYKPGKKKLGRLTADTALDAARRPLGAYFRVNHRDLVAMHSALSEVGILYATASVHEGWDEVGEDGIIPYGPDVRMEGGHAFAIVAYDQRGFWIQNSWGDDWGDQGFCQISYDDWLANGTDVWVARLGAPAALHSAAAQATGFATSAQGSRAYVFCDLRPHIISTGNNGELRTEGTFGTSAEDVEQILKHDFPRLTAEWTGKKRLLLYAHGGLVGEDNAIQRVADYRSLLLSNQIFPLAFIWKTDFWTTVTNILQDAMSRRRPEGILDAAKDFMLDRLDDALEPVGRALGGKLLWDEMKGNAIASSESTKGGAMLVANLVRELVANDPSVEVHTAGHSAGSIFLGPMVPLLTQGARGVKVATCTLWAPACTLELFHNYYEPAVADERIKNFTLFTMTDQAEQDDNCANIYNKSLLYLVSNAFEAKARIPRVRDGIALLGMEKFVRSTLNGFFQNPRTAWVQSPNAQPEGSADAARARAHGAFDDDPATLKATLARILGQNEVAQKISINRSGDSQRARRQNLVLERSYDWSNSRTGRLKV